MKVVNGKEAPPIHAAMNSATQRKNRDIRMNVVSANSLIPQRPAPEYTMSSLNKQEILIL